MATVASKLRSTPLKEYLNDEFREELGKNGDLSGLADAIEFMGEGMKEPKDICIASGIHGMLKAINGGAKTNISASDVLLIAEMAGRLDSIVASRGDNDPISKDAVDMIERLFVVSSACDMFASAKKGLER